MYRPLKNRSKLDLPILEVAGLTMLVIAVILLVVQVGRYSQGRQELPRGLEIGGVPVGGLTPIEAQAYIEQVYSSQIIVMYRDAEIRLDPAQVAFEPNTETMLANAAGQQVQEDNFWAGFWDFIWGREATTVTAELSADYSEELLRQWISDVAIRYDSPAVSAQPRLDNLSFEAGSPGYTLDQEAAFSELDAALRQPVNRTVSLPIDEVTADRPGMETLEALVIDYLNSTDFGGTVSLHVVDLETGEEMMANLNMASGQAVDTGCPIVYASTSTMKIAIMIEYFRTLDFLPEPGSDQFNVLWNSMVNSGNVAANFMIQTIGYGTTQGVPLQITQTMDYLGVENSLIMGLYDDPTNPEYYSTPAREAYRSGECISTTPDIAMQTTAHDMAYMLEMIYQCANYNGGALIAAYPDEITQDECRLMLDTMAQNEFGVLVMSGVPFEVPVAHKHGYTVDTVSDTAVVFSPNGDYVQTTFIWGGSLEWMDARISFPLIQDISTAVYNYFNPSEIGTPRRGLLDLENPTAETLIDPPAELPPSLFTE